MFSMEKLCECLSDIKKQLLALDELSENLHAEFEIKEHFGSDYISAWRDLVDQIHLSRHTLQSQILLLENMQKEFIVKLCSDIVYEDKR